MAEPSRASPSGGYQARDGALSEASCWYPYKDEAVAHVGAVAVKKSVVATGHQTAQSVYEHIMLITPKNWMDLVIAALDGLPAPLREGLSIKPEVVESVECQQCKHTQLFLATSEPGAAPQRGAVPVSTAQPRISIYRRDHLIVSAVLVRLAKGIDVVVPEHANARFRTRSPTDENSAEALRKCVRDTARTTLASLLEADEP